MQRNKIINYIKDISISVPKTLNHNTKTVINHVETANIFNNRFASVAEKIRANENYSNKSFPEYIETNPSRLFYLPSANKNEISSIISSLDPNKSVGPKNIPAKILKLLDDEISFHFSDTTISLFLWLYSRQSSKLAKSFLYIKWTLSSTAITIA